MGIFGNTNDAAITEEVENATNENNTEENWSVIMTICDLAGKSSDIAKQYLKAIMKRLYHKDPHISVQAVTLLDACVKNSGKLFHCEVASREFENDFNKLMSQAHPKVSKLLREALKRWAENEFKTDHQLTLIPTLYTRLKSSGLDFSSTETPLKKKTTVNKDPNVVETQEEEDQILKAIELSLKENSPKTTKTNIYPTAINITSTSTSVPAKEPVKVRALYDFEAAEDNELTFSAGEIIFVLDESDQNWWKGSNQRGEGFFPSNFVTKDLSMEPESYLLEKAKKISQSKEVADTKSDIEPEKVEIDQTKIDRLLHLLHEADPTNPERDTEEMLQYEREVDRMGPLIDAELERVDRKHAQLTQLSTDLVEALSLYHTLMREPQFPSINKIPFGYNTISQPQPTLTYNGAMTLPSQSMPPQSSSLPPGHDRFMMGPGPSHFPPISMPGVLPTHNTQLPGPAPLPPHMMTVMPEDRRHEQFRSMPPTLYGPAGIMNYPPVGPQQSSLQQHQQHQQQPTNLQNGHQSQQNFVSPTPKSTQPRYE